MNKVWRYGLVCVSFGLSQAQRVPPGPSPISSSVNYTLTLGDVVLQVGGNNAARINSLTCQNTQLLQTNPNGGLLWGSTLWASPQAYWTASCKSSTNIQCYPPPTAWDPDTFTGGILTADTSISYTGAADSYTHLRFRKTFFANVMDSSFTNRYTLVNTSNAPITWAPWEDTRFVPGGLTFFPTGIDALTGNAKMISMSKDTLGVTWFTYDSAAYPVSGTPKLFGDCGAPGWYAHVDKNQVLFLKKFTDTPPAKKAPAGESECEIYTANDKTVLEMELQGPYDPIPANDSLAWEVKWFVRKLPANVPIGRNAALLAFVNKTIGLTVDAMRNSQVSPGFGMDFFQGRLTLDLDQTRNLSLSVYDLSGRLLRHVRLDKLAAGNHALFIGSVPAGSHWWVIRDADHPITLYRKLRIDG